MVEQEVYTEIMEIFHINAPISPKSAVTQLLEYLDSKGYGIADLVTNWPSDIPLLIDTHYKYDDFHRLIKSIPNWIVSKEAASDVSKLMLPSAKVGSQKNGSTGTGNRWLL